jgi:hypothetical protein
MGADEFRPSFREDARGGNCMRLMVLTVMGLIGGLGLVAAIVAVPVMAEKGPLRTTLVAHLGGGQEEEVPGGGDPDGRGRAVVKVFKEQLCARVETGAIESSSWKATINLGMSGEKGPTVANLEERAATSLPESTTPTTTTSTGTTTPTTGTITATTGTTGTTGTTTGTTTATTGATGAQQAGTTTTGDTTSPQATTTAQSTTVSQTSLSQSTASPTASASAASASAASTSTATSFEHTGGCVEVPRALSLELLEHPRRFYVNVTNEQYPEGAIRGQLHKRGAGEHRSGDVHHRSGNDDD